MTAERPGRKFGFGCRDTPDLYNKFLAKLGLYRKHTAKESSSLFRVVSEQVYDVQLYHPKVRKECVGYMRDNRALFSKEITHHFETYMYNMYKMRTHGGLPELKALALFYRANVFLYEPLTEGRWFVYNTEYKTTWNIYFGHDNFFDSVYSLDTMKVAANCQAIVYEVLYKNVLNLPDVNYAVERMLHDPEDKYTAYHTDTDGATVATTPDGLAMKLAKPDDNTKCVMNHSHLCHFHNRDKFHLVEQFFSEHGTAEGYRMYIGEYYQNKTQTPNPLLTDPNISCTRQLLALGITPFPYKAAKSLDPCIYRNVEYDVWQELRYERVTELLKKERWLNKQKHLNRCKQQQTRLAMLKTESPQQDNNQQLIANYVPAASLDGTVASSEALALEPVKHAGVYPAPEPQQIVLYDEYDPSTYAIKYATYGDTQWYPIDAQGCLYYTVPGTSMIMAAAHPPTEFQPPVATAVPCVQHATWVPYQPQLQQQHYDQQAAEQHTYYVQEYNPAPAKQHHRPRYEQQRQGRHYQQQRQMSYYRQQQQ